MTVICEACSGVGHATSFLCGPADPAAPLTGEMACDVFVDPCRGCSSTGRVNEVRRRRRNAEMAREDTRLSYIGALARARASWKWSRQP